VIISWFKYRKPVYLEFYKFLSSPEFKAKSEKKRLNRGNTLKHRYVADGHIRRGQRMVRLRVQVLYTFPFSCD
jgi:TolB-like protein